MSANGVRLTAARRPPRPGTGPFLHHATGLPDYDAAAWTSLPPIRAMLRGKGGWGVLLQEPDVAPEGFRPVEVEVPEPSGAVLLVALATSRAEGILSGTGAARPRRVPIRRGEAILVPPGVASRWCSSAGQERVLHVHLPRSFLDDVAARLGCVARLDSLPPGAVPRDGTLDFLLRHVLRQLREQPPGWRLAVESAVTLMTAQLIGSPLPRTPRDG